MKGEWIREGAGNVAVIFVHGIISNEEGCWRHPNGTNWPDLLSEEQDLSDVGIYVFSYRSDIFSRTYSLNDAVDALKEYMRLDGVIDRHVLIFVCHSMGGIVVRRYVVQRQMVLIERNIEIGLFLVASPSLGSDYANFLSSLAKLVGHTQALDLRFGERNTWLTQLDTDFMNLKDTGRIQIHGKELVEDQFYQGNWLFFLPRVVSAFSGARYFGEHFKVPKSDHSSIAKPENARAIQHRLLCDFIRDHRQPSKRPFISLNAPLDNVPAPVSDFVGHEHEIDQLVQTLLRAVMTDATAAIAGVTGMAGVGKTQVAYKVASRLRETFSGGRIEINLRGSTEHPLTVEQALQKIISTWGQVEKELSNDLDTLRDQYRSLLHGQRVLILADDAHDEKQVQPLAPPTSCALLITSRQHFLLDGMRLFPLQPLHPDLARQLFVSICPRSATYAADLVRECGHLPLALRIGARTLELDKAINIPEYLQRLMKARLALLKDRYKSNDPHASVFASLQVSYKALTSAECTLLGWLSLFPTDFRVEAAERLSNSGWDTEDMLSRLHRRSFLEATSRAGRYDMHVLIREFAHSQISTPPPSQIAQVMKEEGNTLAHSGYYLEAQLYYEESLGYYRNAGDDEGIAKTLNSRGLSELYLGNYKQAMESFNESLILAQSLKLTDVIASVYSNSGLIALDQGRFEEAIELFTKGIALFEQLGNGEGVATHIGNLGHTMIYLGRLEEAKRWLTKSLEMSQQNNWPWIAASALEGLGRVALCQGDLNQAERCFCQSLRLFQQEDDREGSLLILEDFALTAIERHQLVLAIHLFGSVERQRQEIRLPRPLIEVRRFDDFRNRLTDELGVDTFRSEYATGERMDISKAIDSVLSMCDA